MLHGQASICQFLDLNNIHRTLYRNSSTGHVTDHTISKDYSFFEKKIKAIISTHFVFVLLHFLSISGFSFTLTFN